MKRLKFKLAPGLSPLIAFGIILGIVLFAMGGGVYYLTTNPTPSFSNPTGASIVDTSLQGQYGIETLLSCALIFVGFIGFLLIYESTKHVYNASYATKLLIIGILFVVISIILLYWMLIPKSQWLFPWARS
ncbi:MAG: hypothetical protein ACUVXA_04790 [Candidatus Jordarchaeum sp.]|uniref:hypothetical protein n=1 Tax=Candidatus Jordarchaeum sp. TaxID=2823881 RepID=UPI00404A0C21